MPSLIRASPSMTRDEAARGAEPLHDLVGGYRVGGGDDRAEGEGRSPCHAVDQGVRDERHPDGGGDHQADRGHRDRPQIAA